MFKVCVQNVYSHWIERIKTVNVHPQKHTKSLRFNLPTGQKTHILLSSFKSFTRRFPQGYRPVNNLLNRTFSPLSTHTITTTTNL